MQHTARGLLAYEELSDSFLEGSNPSHPAVNIQTGFAGWCHGVNRARARKVALLGTTRGTHPALQIVGRS
jgi:hypothetical protein